MDQSKFKILVVEDDENLGFVISDLLELKGFNVEWAKDGNEGLQRFGLNQPHLCVVDIMMPKKDGFSLVEDIKELNPKIPVIFLTARAMEEDRVKGFQLGADDYISKPFSNTEFILRIEAVLNRCYTEVGSASSDKFELGAFSFNAKESQLDYQGEIKKLTQRENEILKLLSLQMNTTVKRETILKVVWGSDDYFSGRSLDVFIAKLRKYLNADSTVFIENVHGVGFKLATNLSNT